MTLLPLAPPIQSRDRTLTMPTAILNLANDAGVVVHVGAARVGGRR